MPNQFRLNILCKVREEAGLTQKDAALACGITSKQGRLTLAKWEQGKSIPNRTRRERMIGYLWDTLRLRNNPAKFEEVWTVLVEEWGWDEIGDREWDSFTKASRASAKEPALQTSAQAAEEAAQPTAEEAQTSVPPAHPEPPTATTAAITAPKPFQAPLPTTHFAGRQNELFDLQTRLSQGLPPRIVALVGMGGVGKSTLAAQVAHELREYFRDGVLWGYAATSNPLDILGSWATAYGYDFSGLSDLPNRAAAVRGILAEKETLLIIDDVTSLESVQHLLPNSQGCAVLLTTRSEEVASGLEAEIISINELTPTDGLQLLTNILGDARVRAEEEAAQEICALLHHLPLAVEITAQYLAPRKRRRLADMAEHLASVQNRLGLKISDRDVRTSFAVSWDGLDEEHQAAFAYMGVFQGRSFAADAIVALLKLDLFTAQDQLEMLKALSLVWEEGEDRYRQHPLLADFAQEQLEMMGESDHVYMEMARHYQAFADAHQTDYELLEPEWDNIMAGMEAAHGLEESQLVIDFAETLTGPWFTRAEYSRARQGYAWAVEEARKLQNEEVEARMLYHWGTACLEQSEYDEASEFLNQSLEIGYHLESDEIIADTQFKLASIYVENANYEKAEKLLSACKTIRDALADSIGTAAVTYWQGFIAYRYGDDESARNYCLIASQMQKQENDELGLLRTYRLLTDVSFRSKDIDHALHVGEQALAISEQLQDRGEYAASLYNLSKVYRRVGSLELAQKSAEISLVLFSQMGSKIFQALTLFELSKIKRATGDISKAINDLQQSISYIRLVQDNFSLVTALRYLGDIQKQMGDIDSALVTWNEAFDFALMQNHPEANDLKVRLQENSPPIRCEDQSGDIFPPCGPAVIHPPKS
ncbi:MAG: NB-ARC domain-containing protein [Chloroflexota bacterium]